MRNKIIKIICLTVAIVTCAGIMCACNNNDDGNSENYNAVLYENLVNNLNENYLWENSTKGTEYKGEYLANDNRPSTNVKIIKNQLQFRVAFNDFPTEVNFDKEMLILYFFTGSTMFNEYSVDEISRVEDKLKINIKVESLTGEEPLALPPMQICFVIKIDKQSIDNAEISFVWVERTIIKKEIKW